MAFDAIVVGGGIIGSACAYYLGQKGLKVVLVERAQLGGGTSATNFAWANASSKTSNRAYHDLNAHGVALYGELAAAFGAKALGIRQTGALAFARKTYGSDYTAKQQRAAMLQEFGYPVEWLDNSALRRAEPNLHFADDVEALHTPSEKIVNVGLFMQFLAAGITQAGGQIIEHCLAQEVLADEAGVINGLMTSKGPLHANRVVVAAGPETPETLTALTGYDGFSRFPVNKVPGLLVTTPPLPKDLIRHLIYSDGSTEVQFQPDYTGGLRIGSDFTDGLITEDQSPENLRKQGIELLKRVGHYLPNMELEHLIDGCKLAIGVRAYPADGKTIAGALPGSDGLFVIATHSGITLAPAVGSLMAEVIADGSTPEMLAPFSLQRLEGFG